MNRDNVLRWLLIVCLLLALLYAGRPLLIPLTFSVLTAFVSYPLCRRLEDRRWPRWAAIGVCLFCLMLFMSAIVGLGLIGLAELESQQDVITQELRGGMANLRQYAIEKFRLSNHEIDQYIQDAESELASIVKSSLQAILTFSVSSLAMLILIPILVALLLANREILTGALVAALPKEGRPMAKDVLRESVQAFFEFVKGMGIVYLVVGVCNSLGLLAFGIDNWLFYGFLASILTFIPYLGIAIGGSVPVALAFSESAFKGWGVIAVFTFVQYLESNVIFPRAVGYRLKVNTLMMLLSLITGGLVWGGAGLVLWPPLVGILKIVADKVEAWKPLAILLGPDDPEAEPAQGQAKAKS